MKGVVILLSFIVAVVLLFIIIGFRRRRRRAELMNLRLDAEQRSELEKDFPLYARLPVNLRDELDGLIHVFIEEKSFEACGGIEEITDHMRYMVAAEACLLLLNRPHNYYRKLRSILIYPSAYRAKNEDGRNDVRLGESWSSGSVVLAWDSVISGGRNVEDGANVTLHEFAHQLDQEDGHGDGVPILPGGKGLYREWSQVFSSGFEKFQRKLDKGKRTVIDPYGATNPAEFFAVATETFYEKPQQLREKYPQVYEQLRRYYNVDPIHWS